MGNGSLTSAELKMDPESIKEIVRASIYQSLDDQARERLIAAAIEYLLEPTQRYTGAKREAPLTEIFNQALTQATREVIFESFKNDPRVKKAINDVVHPMVQKLSEGNYDGLPEAIGEAFGSWLKEQNQHVSSD